MWGKENANNQCLQHHENARGESSCSAHDRHARIPDREETMAWHTFPNVSIETARRSCGHDAPWTEQIGAQPA